MISAVLGRWRALGRRSRAAFLLGATAVILAGFWFALGWTETWPPRAVFRDPRAALPLGFSPDGQFLLTYGRDGITPWDVASGRKGRTWALKSGGHPEMGTFSPDGKTYVAGVFAYPGPLSIDFFDTTTGRIRSSTPSSRGVVAHLAFDADGQTVRAFLGDDPQQGGCSSWNPAFGADLNEVVTLDAATGRALSRRTLTAPTREAATAISPDGRTLAIADRMASIQLWDLDTDLTLGPLTNPATTAVVQAGMGFSPDGRVLAIGRTDGSIELWDVPGRRLLKTLRGHTVQFTHTMFRFSPDGRTLAVTGYRWGPKTKMEKFLDEVRRRLHVDPKLEPEILVLDVATSRRLAGAAESTRPFYAPDGKTIATGEPDGSTRLRTVPGP